MRFLTATLVGVGFCLMPLLAEASKPDPKPKESKVLVAHLQDVVVMESEEMDEELGPVLVTTTTKYYVVIEVSPNAADAHTAHGDISAEGYMKGDKFTVVTTEVMPVTPE